MKQTFSSLVCTFIIAFPAEKIHLILGLIGGVWVIINQYYRTKRDKNKNHGGSWISYFKSLKDKNPKE